MKILVATDGSEYSRAAVRKCGELISNPEETEVKIVSAYTGYAPIDAFPQSIEYMQELENSLRDKAQSFANEAAEEIRAMFPNVHLKIGTTVVMGTPEKIILDTADKWEADLIIVGSHGYGFWSRALLGSVSNSIAHHARCSVLIVHEKKPAKVSSAAMNLWQTS